VGVTQCGIAIVSWGGALLRPKEPKFEAEGPEWGEVLGDSSPPAVSSPSAGVRAEPGKFAFWML